MNIRTDLRPEDRAPLEALLRATGFFNARELQVALELIDEFGSLAAYVWPFAPGPAPAPRGFSDLQAVTPASTALSRDLKRRGWSFVGPTTMHAFMQAMGMVNDHLTGCWVRIECERLRRSVVPKYLPSQA